MYNVEKYVRVRRAVLRDGMSHSEAARVFGVDRGTISKMMQFTLALKLRRRSMVET